MDHLCGWTVAVTADHRATEQAALLQRRGADVVLAPLVEAVPVEEPLVRSATAELVGAPVDVFVATSAGGLRSWLAMAWTWDLGEALLDRLRAADVVVRGASTMGVLIGEDLELPHRTPATTMGDVLDHLLEVGVAGRRVGVQLHGGDLDRFTGALEDAGAEVVPVPVYAVRPTAAGHGERLLGLVVRGELDAVTCTSTAAARALAAVPGLVGALDRASVLVATTGPAPAAVLLDAGLPEVVVPAPHRLGSMVRALGEGFAPLGRTLEVGGVELRHQGSRIAVDGDEVRLTPRERRVLDAILAGGGAVISKERLAALAWDEPVDAHTVEVAINRLRRKLGPAAPALETSNRRGYRLAV